MDKCRACRWGFTRGLHMGIQTGVHLKVPPPDVPVFAGRGGYRGFRWYPRFRGAKPRGVTSSAPGGTGRPVGSRRGWHVDLVQSALSRLSHGDVTMISLRSVAFPRSTKLSRPAVHRTTVRVTPTRRPTKTVGDQLFERPVILRCRQVQIIRARTAPLEDCGGPDARPPRYTASPCTGRTTAAGSSGNKLISHSFGRSPHRPGNVVNGRLIVACGATDWCGYLLVSAYGHHGED